jgi:type IX secretion system PorP/SprF family membrane protein
MMRTIKRLKQLLITIGLTLACTVLYAQDHQYSQFFNSPIYLNPALTGQFDGDLRMNMIYRNQWTNLGGGLKYLTASIDYNIPNFGGGVGLMFTHGSEGSNYLSKNNIAGTYSYSIGSDSYVLSFGLQAGVTNRSLSWSNLIFSDQIDPRLGLDPSLISSAELPVYNSRFYFDSGAGVNLVTGDFMIGSALQHLNKPNESFTGAPAKLPMRFTTHVSYILDLKKYDNLEDDEKSFLIPSVVFNKQSNAQSLNAGVQFKRRGLNAGLWFRSAGSDGPSAIGVAFIFDLFINKEGREKIRFGLSHDAPISKLSYTNTSGTTEGSIGYKTTLPDRNEPYNKFENARRCYDFY